MPWRIARLRLALRGPPWTPASPTHPRQRLEVGALVNPIHNLEGVNLLLSGNKVLEERTQCDQTSAGMTYKGGLGASTELSTEPRSRAGRSLRRPPSRLSQNRVEGGRIALYVIPAYAGIWNGIQGIADPQPRILRRFRHCRDGRDHGSSSR